MANTKRTDMASELISDLGSDEFEKNGLSVSHTKRGLSDITTVEVVNAKGAALIGRGIGKYITLSMPSLSSGLWRDFVPALAELFSSLLPVRLSCLVAALGNPDITPDSLGPLTAEKLLVTHHLDRRDGRFASFGDVAVCRCGVSGTSGMDSASVIRAAADIVKPSAVVVVDALACREEAGLCRSVQLSSTGISPGSGVGNDRKRIDAELLGVPVISVGVPTVIDLASLAGEGHPSDLFVTPRDIDFQMRAFAKLIAAALNLVLHPGLSLEDIEALTE